MKTDLQKYLDTKKTDSRLLGDIERHLMRQERPPRSTLVLHPSEIIKPDFCHRYSFYLLSGGEPKVEKPNLRLQNIFDEGHAIHHKWQKRFQDMGVLFGEWQCLLCGTYTEGVSPKACTNCNSTVLEYREVTLRDDSLRISGHTDGWIKGIGDDCLIEIKSIGAGTFRFEAPELLYDADNDVTRAWKNIRRPFRGHLLQGQMYLELARRMFGDSAPKEIVFLYELKADQDYKEFTVKADYDIVDRIFHKAKLINDAVYNNEMPECNIDPKNGCKSCNLIQ